MEKRTITVFISVTIETTKSDEIVFNAIKRGIYRGCDTPPVYVAQPKDVNFNYVGTDSDSIDTK